MRVTEQRVQRLVHLGLSEAQARAYLALLDLGPAGIGDVCRVIAVPRTRLYQVFQELHRLGVVDVLPGEPIRYAPRSLDAYLKQRMGALEEEQRLLEAQAPDLLREFSLPAAASGDVRTRVFQGRRNALLHLAEGIEGAKASLVLACTRHTLHRLAGAELDVAVAARASLGASVEVLLPPDVPAPEAFAHRAIVVHRMAAPLPMEVLLADGRSVVAVVPRPDDKSVSQGDDEGIASTSAAFYALFASAVAGMGGLPHARARAKERP